MKKLGTYRYSPLPMEQYRLPGVVHDEVSVFQGKHEAVPAWNLFWLSNPTIDTIPGSGNNWHRSYRPTEGLLGNILKDVLTDDDLYYHLTLHPLTFLEWFDDQEFNDYLTFTPGWKATVDKRANESADRFLASSPPREAFRPLWTHGGGVTE